MGIYVKLHKTHRRYTDGEENIEVAGKNVGECLRDLISRYPPLEKEIFKGGKLSPLIEIYLNGESTYPKELEKSVKDGDVINLVYMLAGG